MGIRVSKEEKLTYCVQALLDLYSKLDAGFGKFVTEDFSEGIYSNSLYDVGVSSTFTPLDELLVELDVDFYRKGTNTLAHRFTLGIGKVLSSTDNSVQVVRLDVWSIPCYRGRARGDLAKHLRLESVTEQDMLTLLEVIQKPEILTALYQSLPNISKQLYDFVGE